MTGLTATTATTSVAAPVEESPGDSVVEQRAWDEMAAAGITDFWVYLRDQADLSAASAVADRDAQGRLVYEQLTATAEASQAGLLELLDREGVGYKSFWIANTVKVTGDEELLARIAALPEVAQVTADRVYEIPEPIPAEEGPRINQVEWNIDRINAPQVWHELGVTGENIVVGSIDTGAQFDHPALANQYRGNLGDGRFDHNHNWHDPSNICGSPSLTPCDNVGHGTHVTGTMVGDDDGDNQIGVAPGARWIAAKGCETTGCSQGALLSAGQFMLAPTDLQGENADPALRPHIVNNSWGGPATVDPWYQPTVAAWVAAGIFPQFANGNTQTGVAPCGSSSNPGNLPETYAAGAFDINNAIADFSNRGPSAWDSDLVKPNISAPGVAVRSSLPGGGYGASSGTSMASPHVAGTVALMWSAAVVIERDIDATRELLDLTAIDTEDLTCGGTPDHNNVWGQGRLDAFAAVESSPRGPTGRLAGVVTDAETEQPVAGATVTATGQVQRQRITGPDGTYSIPLPVGEYDVTAAAFAYEPQTAQVSIVEDETTMQDFPLAAPHGRGLRVAPDLLDFGDVPVGDTGGPLSLTVTSTGAEPVTVRNISDPHGGFTPAGGTCGTAPFTLFRLETCTLDYTFRPTILGPAETTVSLASNAADSPHSITLGGTATTAVPAELWVARHNGPASRNDVANAVGVSPDGSRVYVAGSVFDDSTGQDYATIAYDAATGDELWLARYDGPASGGDVALALGLSPDGSRIYVTGRSGGVGTGNGDYATVAYDAATGDELWLARYDGSASGGDTAHALGVGPDGSTVFVTGQSQGDGTGPDYATIAYHAETGEEQWVARYNGTASNNDLANALGVSRDGSTVVATGSSLNDGTGNDYATVAYDAATGDELWVARYDGPTSAQDFANALGVSRDGSMVVATGRSLGDGTSYDYATVAYDVATGDELWVARYHGPHATDVANALGVSPDGSAVFVTGQSEGGVRNNDFATVAYDAATGEEQWVARHNGPANIGDFANALGVSPDGSRVYVAGSSSGDGTGQDYATIAYDAATGDERWLARHDGPASGQETANALGVSPDGSRVYVTGGSQGMATNLDYTTVAYDAADVEITCDRTLSSTHVGPLTVSDEVLCLNGARVVGPVRVQDGAGLVSVDATVTGPLTADGAATLELTDTQVTGSVTATGVTSSLVLWDNHLAGQVMLTDNSTGDTPIVVSGNRIIGSLSCSNNQPPPTNNGEPNVVTGRTSGQCVGL